MSPITNEYLNLIEQMHLYLMQEYTARSWLDVSRESYLNYRAFASTMQPNVRKPDIANEKLQSQTVEIKPTPTLTPKPLQKQVEPPKAVVNPPSPDKKIEKTLVEPLNVKQVDDFADIRKIVTVQFPEQVILAQPPDDQLARTIKDAWKNKPPNFYIVATHIQQRHHRLLTNICKAIHNTYGLNVEVIEKKLQEPQALMIELGEMDAILRDPQLKIHLWQTISEKLKRPSKA